MLLSEVLQVVVVFRFAADLAQIPYDAIQIPLALPAISIIMSLRCLYEKSSFRVRGHPERRYCTVWFAIRR